MKKTNVLTLALLGLGTLGLSGCWGSYYREMREDAFAAKVADKCVEAARPEVIVVPGSSTATVVAPPAQPK